MNLITDDFGNLLLTSHRGNIAAKLADARSDHFDSDDLSDAAFYGRVGYDEMSNRTLAAELDMLRDDEFLFDEIVPDHIRDYCEDELLEPTILVYGKPRNVYHAAHIVAVELMHEISGAIASRLPDQEIDPDAMKDRLQSALSSAAYVYAPEGL